MAHQKQHKCPPKPSSILWDVQPHGRVTLDTVNTYYVIDQCPGSMLRYCLTQRSREIIAVTKAGQVCERLTTESLAVPVYNSNKTFLGIVA